MHKWRLSHQYSFYKNNSIVKITSKSNWGSDVFRLHGRWLSWRPMRSPCLVLPSPPKLAPRGKDSGFLHSCATLRKQECPGRALESSERPHVLRPPPEQPQRRVTSPRCLLPGQEQGGHVRVPPQGQKQKPPCFWFLEGFCCCCVFVFVFSFFFLFPFFPPRQITGVNASHIATSPFGGEKDCGQGPTRKVSPKAVATKIVAPSES